MQVKKGKLSYTPIKLFFNIIHLLALLIFMVGIILLYTNPNFKKGIYLIGSEKFEESSFFISKFEKDTVTIFDYVFLKRIFETDGELDESKPVFVIEKGQGLSEEYTIGDVLETSKDLGFYFDSNYEVVVSSLAGEHSGANKDIGKRYILRWRSYDNTPGTNESNGTSVVLDDLIYDTMVYLGRYYYAQNLTDISKSNLRYRLAYGENIYTNDESLVYDSLKKYGKYATVSSDNPIVETNLFEVPENFKYLSDLASKYIDSNYQVMIAVDTEYTAKDSYYNARNQYEVNRKQYFNGLALMITGITFMVISIISLLIMSGVPYHGAKERVIYKSDKMGVEINSFLCFVSSLIFIYINNLIGDRFLHVLLPFYMWKFAEKTIDFVIVYLCVLALIFSVVRTIKSNVFLEYSYIKRLKDRYGVYPKELTFSAGLLRNFIIFCLLNIGFASAITYMIIVRTAFIDRLTAVALIIIIVSLDILLYHRINRNSSQKEEIANALKRMSNGDTSLHLNEKDFSGKEAEIVKNLNNIGHGLDKAISEQVKSERMKADLITNVSHDIKTPLTSIINYIDLIKREKITDTKILGYLEVLDKKTQHLKNLTEDLVEASKASSGNLSLEITDIDFVDMIKQTNGEFEEKYETRGLIIVSSLPKEHLIIKADGRRLWRVLENLYNNAFKYAAYGSRVYVEMSKEYKNAVFVIKNMSENPLNISPDELTERFVRGDVSRTTEGSGLGLSIARSLTELQSGVFKIQIDGDLFKVNLHFPLANSFDDNSTPA